MRELQSNGFGRSVRAAVEPDSRGLSLLFQSCLVKESVSGVGYFGDAVDVRKNVILNSRVTEPLEGAVISITPERSEPASRSQNRSGCLVAGVNRQGTTDSIASSTSRRT